MSTSAELRRTARSLYGRTIASMVALLIFIAMAINAHLIEQAGTIGPLAIVPIALAVALLPRRTRTGVFLPSVEQAEEPPEDRQLRVRLARLAELATWLRVIYLGVTLFCFFLLPELVPSPS